MSFKHIFKDDINFNFQVNRLLSYGDIACDKDEVYSITSKINSFETWYKEWRNIAETAEVEKRYIHRGFIRLS